ncbi:hypothetical protein [Hymenobacter sp. B1770]|uniref:hypothetical protein n=1 Tax=Hymenobacter sp. B1770 TaxID=1718788 RepID=UPI003CEF59B2
MRFLLLLGSLCLLGATVYLAGIFWFSSYEDLARLGAVPYHEYVPDGPSYLQLALTPSRYAAFRTGLGILLAGSLISSALLILQPAYRSEFKGLGQEARQALGALRGTAHQLSRTEVVVSGGLLLAILLARLCWLFLDPMSPDEITSYDAFVHQGAAAVTSFYPIPNNHVFYNFLCWIAAQALPNHVLLIVRLPSLLVATVGTAISYGLLTWFLNFRVATVVTALFGLTPLTVLYAASGRGYFMQMVCIELAFFAAVGTVTKPNFQRLGWAVFVLSSIIGLYTIPTYAAPLVALAVLLLAASLQLPAQARAGYYAHMLGAGAIIMVTAGVLYMPVGTVSGWERLLTNRYLASHSFASFWALSRAHLYETAAMLLGPVRPGLVCSAAVLVLTPLVLVRQHSQTRGQWLAWGAWLMVVTPLVLTIAQRMFFPGRTLMYTTYFLFVLAALGAHHLATKWPRHWPGKVPLALLLALVAWRVTELAGSWSTLRRSREQNALVSHAYQWLQTQPRGPILLGGSYHSLMFHHFGLTDGNPLPLRFKSEPGGRYRYLLVPQGTLILPSWAAALPYHLAYQDALIQIYKLDTPQRN